MHRLFARFHEHRKQNQLSYRLLLYIVLSSTALAILSTGVQLFWDYRNDINNIERGIDSIKAGYLDSLASSLWKLDKDQIAIQLDGIMKLPDISYAAITEIVAGQEETVFQRGDPQQTYPIADAFQLYYRGTLVGKLEVGATLENVYQRLLHKFLVILGSQAVKTFLVSICILVIVHLLVVRHLNTLSRFTQRLDLDNLDEDIQLEGKRPQRERPDALDQLAATLNRMRENIRKQLQDKQRAQQALEELNEELEQRVKYRTATLKHTNDRLSSVIEELKSTRDRLVETEKMAALGGLVAGVAHELNTPVGNSITMATLLDERAARLQTLAEGEGVTRAELQRCAQEIQEASELIHSNLQRTAELVGSFKQIATDPAGELTERFRIHDALTQAAEHFSQELAERGCTLTLECARELAIISYPHSLQLVLQNLISNSLQHGFEHQEGGHIRIRARREQEQIRLTYEDDGVGIPEPIQHRIFDPFVTSKRGQGSTGLGTHIIYNLVTSQLGGTVECHSERGVGTRFEIRLPLAPATTVDDEADDLW